MSKLKVSTWTILFLLVYFSYTPVGMASEYTEFDPITNVCIVYPSGSDDTLNLIEAFNTVIDNGVEGTVELIDGVYKLSQDIVIVNFDGWFKGAGTQKTIIENIYTEEWPHRNVEFFPEVAGLFLFYQTDDLIHNYHFSDMTIRVQGKTTDYFSFTGVNIIEVVGRVNGDKEDLYETEFNTYAENIRFEGQLIDSWHYTNVINPYQIGGEFIITDGWYFKPITGTHIISNCTFYRVGGGPKFNVINGDLDIRNNLIDDCFMGVIIYDPSDLADERNVVIADNIISNIKVNALWLWGSDNMLIKNNTMYDSETGNGINIINGDNNQIIANNITQFSSGAIYLDNSNNNTLVNNFFLNNLFDIAWEGPGGEIGLGSNYSDINRIHISNSTGEKIASLEYELNDVISEKEMLENDLSTIQTDFSDLELILVEAEKDITSLETQMTEASTLITELETRINDSVSYSYLLSVSVLSALLFTVLGYFVGRRK